MTLVTWIAVAVCGPGALAVFLWFLADLLRLHRRHRRGSGDGGGTQESEQRREPR